MPIPIKISSKKSSHLGWICRLEIRIPGCNSYALKEETVCVPMDPLCHPYTVLVEMKIGVRALYMVLLVSAK